VENQQIVDRLLAVPRAKLDIACQNALSLSYRLDYSRLEIECSCCNTKRDVDLAALRHPPTMAIHDLASRLRCSKCAKAGRRPAATLLQLAQRHLRLADFIRQNEAAIVREWIEFARTRSPASDGMSKPALPDHVVDILKFVSADLKSQQTPAEQFDKARGHGDRTDPPPKAPRKFMPRCVSRRLGQALSNLMSNAIQYGDTSKPVTGSIAGHDPAFVEISVHNSGSPIPPDVQKTIFESRGQVEGPEGTRI